MVKRGWISSPIPTGQLISEVVTGSVSFHSELGFSSRISKMELVPYLYFRTKGKNRSFCSVPQFSSIPTIGALVPIRSGPGELDYVRNCYLEEKDIQTKRLLRINN